MLWRELKEDSSLANMYVGLSFYELGRYEEAIDSLERAVEKGALYRAFDVLGKTYIALENPSEALEIYLEGAEVYPKQPLAYANVAEIQALLGNCEASEEWLLLAQERGLNNTHITRIQGMVDACAEKN